MQTAKTEQKTHKTQRRRGLPAPAGELFEAHGSEFEPNPSIDPGQASYMRISSAALLFHIAENALDGFLAPGVNFLALGRVAQVLGAFEIVGPNVAGDHFRAIFAFGAFRAHCAICTNICTAFVFAVAVAVGGAVAQNLVCRADVAVVIFVVNVLVL